MNFKHKLKTVLNDEETTLFRRRNNKRGNKKNLSSAKVWSYNAVISYNGK